MLGFDVLFLLYELLSELEEIIFIFFLAIDKISLLKFIVVDKHFIIFF